MRDQRTLPPAEAKGMIPDLVPLQTDYVRRFLAIAKANKLRPVLSQFNTTPNLAFDVPASKKTRSFLKALFDEGWTIEVAETGAIIDQTHLSVRATKIPRHLSIFKPVIIGGRMIHGSTSGVHLHLRSKDVPTTIVTFPSKLFHGHVTDAMLDGLKLPVRTDLLEKKKTCRIPDRVDIVYTWVDDADPHWQRRRRAHSPDDPSADAEDATRFRNHNELLFSLRSLFRYFTGIGRVFIVTDAQTPDFIDEFKGKVEIIDHTQIMGPDVARPVFNSHVIESCLHNIEGLASQYLYLNDDFLFAKPTCPADFFTTDGKSKAFYSVRWLIPKGNITKKTLAVDVAAINARKLLAKKFDHHIKRKFQHAPVAIHRNVMVELEKTFARNFARLRKNQFRSKTDISPSGSFYQHYALMKGHAVASEIQYRYYDTAKSSLPLKLLKLSCESDRQRPKVHCINSTGDRALSWVKAKYMQYQLTELYPPATSKRCQNTWHDKFRFAATQKILALHAVWQKRANAKKPNLTLKS